jgi:hypothetical protein
MEGIEAFGRAELQAPRWLECATTVARSMEKSVFAEPPKTKEEVILRPVELPGLPGALSSLNNVELHRLAFFQALEARGDDGAVMTEDIRTAIASEEAKAFCVVEPLYRSAVLSHDFLVSRIKIDFVVVFVHRSRD